MKRLSTIILSLACIGLIQITAEAAEIIPSEELVEQLRSNPAAIKTRGIKTRNLGGQSFGAKKGRANMSAIQFEYNSAQLTEGGRKQVDELAQAIEQLGQDTFQVIGHTDASGSSEYNFTLSKRRANSVYDALINDFGVDPSRLIATGKGEDALINPQNPNAAENRRVEAVNTTQPK